MGKIDWSGLYVWIGSKGVKMGLLLIGMVTAWDVLIMGTRGFFEYSIGYKGIVLIWIGIALIFKGWKIERNK